MLRKSITAFVATLVFVASQAQDSTKSLTISGNLDGYYRYNFNGGKPTNNNTSFTNSQSSFELGMASVRADATALSGKVGATVDLGFGRRAEEFSYNDVDGNTGTSLKYLKQAYITFQATEHLKFTAGKFGTHVGYELLDAPLNRNYSMSYMFTNGPFFHTGVKADITAGPVGFMLGVANYTDQSTSTTGVKTILAQVSAGSKDGKFKGYLNYVGFGGSGGGVNPSGLKSLNQIDLVLTAALSSKFNLGFNATLQDRTQVDGSTDPDGSWKGVALYLNADPTDVVGITLRSEYISDDKTVYFGTKNIFANTLSFNFKAGPLTFIPEVRYETSKDDIFYDKDGVQNKSSAFSGLLAAVFKF